VYSRVLLVAGSPGISFGIYDAGFNDDVSNFGTNVYFADSVSLLVGPVFFWTRICSQAAASTCGRRSLMSTSLLAVDSVVRL
jgi:hypothetical protein